MYDTENSAELLVNLGSFSYCVLVKFIILYYQWKRLTGIYFIHILLETILKKDCLINNIPRLMCQLVPSITYIMTIQSFGFTHLKKWCDSVWIVRNLPNNGNRIWYFRKLTEQSPDFFVP